MKKKITTNNIDNKRARFDYDLKDEYIAGVVLSGAEVKSLRRNRGSLQGSFVTLKDNEAWLNNMQIMPENTNAAHMPEETQTRTRKLLLNKKELTKLQLAKEQGLTIVPLKVLTKGRYIKAVIYTAKGKKLYDKRAKLKARDTNRDISRDLKRY